MFNIGTSLYNIGGPIRIKGAIDFSKLEEAINILIQNNEGLRLRFIKESGEMEQFASNYESVKLDLLNICNKCGGKIVENIALISVSYNNQFSNLGLDRLCTVLRNNGHVVYMKYYHNNEDVNFIINDLLDLDVSIYGFSTSSLNIENIYTICKSIKHDNPNNRIILGGPFSTIYYSEILNDTPDVDFIVLGDGEETILYLMENIDNIDNIKNNIHIVTHNKTNDGSQFAPFIYDKPNEYMTTCDFFEKNENPLSIYSIQSKNNICTGNCTFCCERKQRDIIFRPVEEIANEILYMNDKYNITRFFFIDDDLLDPNTDFSRQRIETLCDILVQSKKKLLLQCYTKSNVLKQSDLLLLQKMATAGFVSLLIGVEAGNADDLKLYGKACNVENNYNAIKLIKAAGLFPQLGFIGFNPYTTQDKLTKNFNFLIANKVSDLLYYTESTLSIIKGTKIYEQIKADKLLQSEYGYKNLKAYKYNDPNIENIKKYLSTFRGLQKTQDFDLTFHFLTKYTNKKYKEQYEAISINSLSLIKNFFYPLYYWGSINMCEEKRKQFEDEFSDLEKQKEALLNRLLIHYMRSLI